MAQIRIGTHFSHVNVVSSRSSATIFSRFSLDCDCLSRTNGFTQFTSNTAFFAWRREKWIMQAINTNIIVETNEISHQNTVRLLPVGYLLNACSPLNLGLRGPFSWGYMIVNPGFHICSNTSHIVRNISVKNISWAALSRMGWTKEDSSFEPTLASSMSRLARTASLTAFVE